MIRIDHETWRLRGTFEDAYQCVRDLPPPRPGHSWYVCAEGPDQSILTIYQATTIKTIYPAPMTTPQEATP